MGFKNHIRHMAAIVGKTLLKTFPKVLHHSLGYLMWNGVHFLSDPFLQILKRSRTMFENLFFRYPKRKKSHGLKSGDRAGHPTSRLKEIKRPWNISLNTPSERRAV
jgi:hypothetical protein